MRIETDMSGQLLKPEKGKFRKQTLNDVYEYLISYYASLQSITNMKDNIYLPSMWYLGYGIIHDQQPSNTHLYAINIDFDKHTQFYQQLQSRAYDAFVCSGYEWIVWRPARFPTDQNLTFFTSAT